jgi:hypothetical protein
MSDEPPLATVSDEDACTYCGELFSRLDDRDALFEHLKVAHGFGKCQPAVRFVEVGHAMFHLANVHNVLLSDWTAEVMDSCRREEPPLMIAAKAPKLDPVVA